MEKSHYSVRLKRMLKEYEAAMAHTEGNDDPTALSAARKIQADTLHALRELRHEIVIEEKEIGLRHATAMEKAEVKEHFLAKAIMGRGAKTRMRESHKRSLKNHKAELLEPLRHAKLNVDEAITHVTEAKKEVTAELSQFKKVPRRKIKVRREKPTFIDELERLASLHESGALSDEEFAAAKSALLAHEH